MFVENDPIAQALHAVTGIPLEEIEEIHKTHGATQEGFDSELDKFLVSKGFNLDSVIFAVLLYTVQSSLLQN